MLLSINQDLEGFLSLFFDKWLLSYSKRCQLCPLFFSIVLYSAIIYKDTHVSHGEISIVQVGKGIFCFVIGYSTCHIQPQVVSQHCFFCTLHFHLNLKWNINKHIKFWHGRSYKKLFWPSTRGPAFRNDPETFRHGSNYQCVQPCRWCGL